MLEACTAMGSDTSAGVPGDTKWPDVEAIWQNIEIVPEDTLRKIAQGPLVEFTLECDDFE